MAKKIKVDIVFLLFIILLSLTNSKKEINASSIINKSGVFFVELHPDCFYRACLFIEKFDMKSKKEKLKEYKKKYYKEHKKEIKIWNREYYLNHKEEKNKYHKEWRDNNKNKIKQYNKNYKKKYPDYRKKYCEKNKEKLKINYRKWYIKNKDKIRKKGKEYYIKNKEIILNKNAIYQLKNKKAVCEKQKEWRIKNKKHIKEYRIINKKRHAEIARIYCKNNIQVRIKSSLSSIIRYALKDKKKIARTMDLVGCSALELRQYLESKFQKGMTWNNYGRFGWHIDHIRPVSSFDLSDPKQQKQCFHYTNLQPLWWKENLKKHAKYYESIEISRSG